jgi:C-terminal processing protease CtpA/Prc
MKFKKYSLAAFLLLSLSLVNAQKGKSVITGKINTLNSAVVEKYFSFAKAYGYIKYFYPGDDAATIDWDKFAFYGASYLGNSSTEKVKNNIESLFFTMAPDIKIHLKDKPPAVPTSSVQPDAKTVYWQHLGDGKGSIGYPYKSMRVNRPARVLPESTNDFATIRMNLPVEQFLGKEIRLNGKILADPVYTGDPSLIILIKEKGKDTKRVSSQGQRISSETWLPHSITAKIPDSAEQVTLIAQSITLSGSIKFDDLSWAVKEGNEWQVKELVDFNTMDSAALNRQWKKFAPSQDIELGGNKDEQWVDFSRAKGQVKQVDPLFAATLPKNEWLTKSIGSGLSVTFPLVIHAGTPANFPGSAGVGYKELISKMDAIPFNNFKAENIYCRLANVIILWNKIQHFHPDNPMTTLQWENQLRKAISQSLLDKTLEDHRNTLTQMIAPVNDSHMTLYYSEIVMEEFYLPLQWEKIENKIVITNVFDPALPFSPGDIVTHINGMAVEKYWQQMNNLVVGATASRKESKIMDESLKGRKGSMVYIKTVNSDREIVLERKLTEFEFKNLVKAKKKFTQYQQVKPGVIYVDLREISWKDLQSHLSELSVAKGIIFDLRGYPTWQTHNIVSHFIHKPVSQMKYGMPVILYPDRMKMEFLYDTVNVLEPQQPYIQAHKVFLTDGKAISYAEDFLNLISYYKLADVAGQPTAATTGNVNMCYLFGGLSTPWTGMRILRQDGISFNGKGILPDRYIKKSIRGVKEGRDDYVEYVLKNLFKF